MKSFFKNFPKLFFLAIFCIFTSQLMSQVTIGSGIPPRKGLLLDLKENDSDEDNSKKGLGIPRVALESLTKLTIDDDIKGKSYRGTIIFNTTEDESVDLDHGLYLWDGLRWTQQAYNVSPIIGNAGGTSYSGEIVKGIPTGISIELPPFSTWVVSVSQLIRLDRQLAVGEALWLRFTFSDTDGGEASPDIKGGKIISCSLGSGIRWGLLSGVITIENKGEEMKRYFLSVDNPRYFGEEGAVQPKFERTFANWGENSLTGIPAGGLFISN